jgi:hypothetical protein
MLPDLASKRARLAYGPTRREAAFYEACSEYLRWSYDTKRALNGNAAAMVVAVLQRRLASSTITMLQIATAQTRTGSV